MSGDAGKKARWAKREMRKRGLFPGNSGLTTHRLQRAGDLVSLRLASWIAQNLVLGAHGRRSRQKVMIPQHDLRLRVHRFHTRCGVFLDSVRRFPVKLAHGLGPKPSCQRCAVCAQEARRRRVRRSARELREDTFASVALVRARLCLLRCSFAALFGGENKGTIRFAWPSRVFQNPRLATDSGRHDEITGFVVDRTAPRQSTRPTQRRVSSRGRRDGLGGRAE